MSFVFPEPRIPDSESRLLHFPERYNGIQSVAERAARGGAGVKKTFIRFIPIILILIATAASAARAASNESPVSLLSSLDDLFFLKSGRSMRSSSSDSAWNTGNADWRTILSNGDQTIADLEGPGIITHIWMTVSSKDRYYSRMMSVRIYWDGEKQPSVEAPLGDFFAVGHGIDENVNSIPVQVSSDGRARNCFWPMPFKKRAKIVVSNENPMSQGTIIYWYVDWIKLDSLPDNAAYFHAQYNQEYPAKTGRYTVMKAEGRGHYVGTVYSAQANMRGWIGEGDDFFFIDGEEKPSIRGTGTEDYFSDAWGFRQFNQPYHGVSLWEGSNTGARSTAYRWHMNDPILFSKSLRFEIEHTGPVYNDAGEIRTHYGQRPDHLSSVAFWYQHGGSPNWTRMPKGSKRIPPHIYIEAEKTVTKKNGKLPKEIEIIKGPQWNGGAYVRFTPSLLGKKYQLRFTLKETGNYEVAVDMVHGPDMGVYIVKLDGRVLQLLTELNSKDVARVPYNWGIEKLSAGKHTLTFEYQEPNDDGKKIGIDGIYLRPVKKD